MTERHRVVVLDAPDLEPPQRLAAALDALGPRLPAVSGSGTVVVVPELGALAEGSPTATDPRLVEALVDLLAGRGWREIIVGAGADDSKSWAGNRDAFALVELLGYRFLTPEGREYDVIDLGGDLVPAPFDPGDALYGVKLNAAWVSADLRVVFAANTSDDVAGFHLALGTCLRVLPPEAAHLVAPADAVAELTRATPVRVSIIDAIESSHGSGGRRAAKPIRTDTVIAADDIWAADRVGALKMGLDPAVSPLFARAPDLGDVEVVGSVDVYEGFVAPHPLMLDAMTRLDSSPWISRLVRPWLQVLDGERFPFESPLDASLNERLASWSADPDSDPVAFATLVGVGYLIGAAKRGIDAYRIMYAKDDITRQAVPLAFDPHAYEPDAYRAITAELASLAQLLDGAEPRGAHLRWRYLDRAVLFDYRRTVPIDFDEFVGAVDVARTISFMNDYLGGVVVVLEHDEKGRSVRQAERNLYLPQPNYLALSGGEPIDVGKLEIVEYEDNRHRLYWKTIESQNDSAVYDDGIVTFERIGEGTLVTIFGRQLFTLPPLWRTIDLALAPELKAHLVTDAYETFFDRTLANLEALCEGRDIGIGISAGGQSARRPADELENLVERLMDRFGGLTDSIRRPAPTTNDDPVVEVDELGFTHFQAASNGSRREPDPVVGAVTSFWLDLIDAGMRDLLTPREVWKR